MHIWEMPILLKGLPVAHRFNRYLVNTINEFLSIAATLKNTTFKPRKDNNEINMENNKSKTIKPKLGDMVFVRDNHTEKFKRRIYIGKIHEKYACVTNTTEQSYNNKTDFRVKLWNEIATKIIITKKEIADKFDYPIKFIKIVDWSTQPI